MPVAPVQPPGCPGVALFSSLAHGQVAKCPQGLIHASTKFIIRVMLKFAMIVKYYDQPSCSFQYDTK